MIYIYIYIYEDLHHLLKPYTCVSYGCYYSTPTVLQPRYDHNIQIFITKACCKQYHKTHLLRGICTYFLTAVLYHIFGHPEEMEFCKNVREVMNISLMDGVYHLVRLVSIVHPLLDWLRK